MSDERKRFGDMTKKERTLCEMLVSHTQPITINESERYLWFLGRRYTLTTHQYLVIARLYKRWGSHPEGYPDSEFQVRHARHHSPRSPTSFADSEGNWLLPANSKIKDSFKRSPLWGYLVIRGADRRLKLNLPLPKTSESADNWLGPPNLDALMAGHKLPQLFGKRKGPQKKKPAKRQLNRR